MAGGFPAGQLPGFYQRTRAPREAPRASAQAGRDRVKIPEHIDWNAHRIASSSQYSCGLAEIETLWSVTDVWDANEVLDLIEEQARRDSPSD